ncbi:protoporphyrinogen oxidase [Devriesea agamarum]|uniref:protoporphyrinogen oxidase n=1 Tax=Devriesea agamarum TaxID=472569 RepID=UPI00071E0744|nr:protoporphyrinogen oxidase [Devriesea agamarum]
MNDTTTARRTLVIGGGISGLLYAWQAQQTGCQVTVLEAASVCGGAIGAHELDGLELNTGAEAFATAGGTVRELLGDLGLSEHIVEPCPSGSWVVTRGGAAPLPAAGYLGIPANPLAPDVRRIIGWPSALRAAIGDALLPGSYALREGTTLGDYVRTRMGRRVLTRLVEPVIGGVHATDPNLLELAAIAPKLPDATRRTGSLARAVAHLRPSRKASGAAVSSLRPSMELLPRTLAQQITDRGGVILTNSPVTGLVRLPDGTYRVSSGPDQQEFTADHVVLAAPGEVTRELVRGVNPAVAELIPVAPPSPVRLVTLVLDAPALRARPRGNGVLIAAETTGVQAKALTHATAKWPHLRDAAGQREIVRLSYGRSGGPLPAPELFPDLALADASRILGVPLDRSQLRAHEVITWERALSQARAGHQAALEDVETALRETPGLNIVGAWRSGTGLAAITGFTRRLARTMEGQL